MIITIASGKGGTGKTTIATNLVSSVREPVILLDCDVEEPNAHLFLRPTLTTTEPVHKPIPSINRQKCTCCGICAEVCAYHALAVLPQDVLVFEHLCHGCGGCALICPEDAITEVGQMVGVIERGVAGRIEFVQGTLKVGEAMAGPVIRAVKKSCMPNMLNIVDAPPGTSCPVVATVAGSNFCVLVTEPTPFGLHDLNIAVGMVRQLGIPHGVIMNRADSGDHRVADYCQAKQIPILMTIPTDRRIAEAYSRGTLMVDILPEYQEQFRTVLTTCRNILFDLSE